MSTSFAVQNTVIPKHMATTTNVNITNPSINTQTLSLSSVNAIPLGENTLYTIRGNLYYKSAGGTITVLAVN